ATRRRPPAARFRGRGLRVRRPATCPPSGERRQVSPSVPGNPRCTKPDALLYWQIASSLRKVRCHQPGGMMLWLQSSRTRWALGIAVVVLAVFGMVIFLRSPSGVQLNAAPTVTPSPTDTASGTE